MNIFLTGECGIGKSTLIQGLIDHLSLDYSGYQSLPIYSNNDIIGFQLRPLLSNETAFQIGKKITPTTCQPMTAAFDTRGVDILKKSLLSSSSCVILDELGFLESEAYKFQEMVIEIIDSNKIVIGVIRDRQTTFLDALRNKEDIELIQVTKENRESLFEKLKEQIGGI